MSNDHLLPHLFRTEYSRITSVLVKHFGMENIQLAEDLASETFQSALETWPYKGTPENPKAWLYAVAKNKARNHLARHQLLSGKIALEITKDPAIAPAEIDLSDQNISDSQLQMLFAVCHPAISPEAQIGLALRILCGFGIDEIAAAFLTNKETINKRLFRAKDKLRTELVRIEMPANAEIPKRLDAVLRTLYLLFSEGYYSENNEAVLRKDLCHEAMRLTKMLLENQATNLPEANALIALMCFHASRFDARKGENGELILYADQDESRWDIGLISSGVFYLKQASQGDRLTKYHLEASIAYWHTHKADTPEKWENILQLFNRLLQIEYSPIAALNRTFALAKANGKHAAITEALKLKIEHNPYYFTLLGELYTGIDEGVARLYFERALALAKTEGDKALLMRRL